MKKKLPKICTDLFVFGRDFLSWRMLVLIKLDDIYFLRNHWLLWGSILKLLEMAGSLVTSSTPEYHHCHHSYNYFHHRQNLQLWPFLRHCIVTIRTLIITWNSQHHHYFRCSTNFHHWLNKVDSGRMWRTLQYQVLNSGSWNCSVKI